MTKSRKSRRFLLAALFIFIFVRPVLAQAKRDPFEMSFDQLMKVKIKTAGKTREQIGSIPAGVVLITRKDIETYGYISLTEILENIPGLYSIDDYTGQDGTFGVRGFWSGIAMDNIIVLVNGVPQVFDYITSSPLSNSPIPVEAIDRIEVVRGPMSVLYGSGAFFGVINIFTDDPSTETLNIVSVSRGSEKTKKLFLRLEGGSNDFSYAVNASFSDTYGIDQPLHKMMTDPAAFGEHDLPPDHRTGGQLEGTRRYFNFSGHFKDLYVDFMYNESEQEGYLPFPTATDGSSMQLNSTRLLLGYRKTFSDTFTIDGKFNYSQIEATFDYDWFRSNFYGTQQNRSKALEAELDVFINPSEKLDIKAGLHYRTVIDATNSYDLPSSPSPTTLNQYFYLGEGDGIVTRAFFVQAMYKPLKNLELVAGLRLEQMPEYKLGNIQTFDPHNQIKVEETYSEDNVEFIPRLALVYSFNHRNIVKLLYGKAINRPSFFQNTKNTLDPLRDDLQPEYLRTLELNYIGVLSPKITLNAGIFRNTLENLVTRILVFDENNNYESWFANAGKMVTTGVELTLQTRPFKGFSLELSGTYQETEDKRAGFENIDVAYSPEFLGYLKASYHCKKFTLAVTGTYVGPMETYWDETVDNGDGPFGNRIGEKAPGYLNLGANLRIEDILIHGFYLNLRVSNLLDQEIRYPSNSGSEWADRGTLGHPRFFLLTLGYKF